MITIGKQKIDQVRFSYSDQIVTTLCGSNWSAAEALTTCIDQLDRLLKTATGTSLLDQIIWSLASNVYCT